MLQYRGCWETTGNPEAKSASSCAVATASRPSGDRPLVRLNEYVLHLGSQLYVDSTSSISSPVSKVLPLIKHPRLQPRVRLLSLLAPTLAFASRRLLAP